MISTGTVLPCFRDLLRGAQVWRISKSLGWVPASATRDQAYEHLNQRVPDDVKCVANRPCVATTLAYELSHTLSCRAQQACQHHGRALPYTTDISKLGVHDEPMTLAQV